LPSPAFVPPGCETGTRPVKPVEQRESRLAGGAWRKGQAIMRRLHKIGSLTPRLDARA
jgi:hypothetical protein